MISRQMLSLTLGAMLFVTALAIMAPTSAYAAKDKPLVSQFEEGQTVTIESHTNNVYTKICNNPLTLANKCTLTVPSGWLHTGTSATAPRTYYTTYTINGEPLVKFNWKASNYPSTIVHEGKTFFWKKGTFWATAGGQSSIPANWTSSGSSPDIEVLDAPRFLPNASLNALYIYETANGSQTLSMATSQSLPAGFG